MNLVPLSLLRRGAMALAALAIVSAAAAQEQRALVIGIDTYQPPDGVTPSNDGGRIDFQNLDGCKNDALSMKQLISLYGFSSDNTRELYDRNATRDAILAEMNRLLSASKKGDVAFIYYAGHGSQVRNTRNGEADQRDESMVPSNTWEKGVSDIRDKELATIFNKFIDKGVKLTVIYDCCHSGSMSRGAPRYTATKPRFIAGTNVDVADAVKPPVPERRPNSDFLMISAAQDNEFAQELVDNNGQPHGAFTVSLLQAIQQNSIDVPVSTLFQSIRSILKSNGMRQEPVLAATDERRHQNLFGVPATKLVDELLVSGRVAENGKVRLQAGMALGVGVGNELELVNDSKVKLRITEMKGVAESEADLVSGKADDIKPGSLFRVTNWVSTTGPLLKLYLPKTVSFEEAQKFAAVLAEVRKSPKIQWIQRIDEGIPDISIYFLNGKWMIENSDNPAPKELGAFTAANIVASSQPRAGGRLRKVYIELPPTEDLVRAVNEQFSNYKQLKLVSDASSANYVLYGTADQQGALAYGLKRIEVDVKDSLEALPLRTRWFPLAAGKGASASVADSLFEYSLRLGKVRGWLLMAPPKKSSFFPFHLEVVDAASKKAIDTAGVRVGDKVDIRLVANSNYQSKPIPQKYIYVFAIDRNGKMTLLFPEPNDGNVGNKFPQRNDSGSLQTDFTVVEDADIVAPTGTDNYFVLASESPIDNYALLFNQDGVRGGDTRGTHGAANPLDDVINMGNAKTRGTSPNTPANWNLVRLSVKTRYK
ncbi:caspase family protein [Flaviaesturariibacter terrae]